MTMGIDRSVLTIRPLASVVVSNPYTNQVLADASAGALAVTLVSRTGRMEHKVAVQKTDDSANTVTVTAGAVSAVLSEQFDAAVFEQDDLGAWHVFSRAVGSVLAASAHNTLFVGDDVVGAETVTIGADVYEVEIVNTDSTDVTDNEDFDNTTNPLTVIDAVLTYANVTFTEGALIRIEDEILRVTAVVGDDVTFQRGASATDIAAHADAEAVFAGDGIDAGSTVAVGLVTTLTPAAFSPALIADINTVGTEAFTASDDSDNVVITADAEGTASNGVETAETLDGAGNFWESAVTFGGRDAGSSITNGAAANTVVKSDGTNLVNSGITDDGTDIVATAAGSINLHAAAMGFYDTSDVARPEIPAVPTEQDIVDALVALGLVTQAP